MQVGHIAIGVDRHRPVGRLGADDDRVAVDRRGTGRIVVGQIHRVGSGLSHRECIGYGRRRGGGRSDRHRHSRCARDQTVGVFDRISEAIARGVRTVMQVCHIAIGVDRHRAVGRLGADDDRVAIDRRSSGRIVVGKVHRVRARLDHRKSVGNGSRRGSRYSGIDIEFRRSGTVSIVRFLEDIVACPTVDATAVSESQVFQNHCVIARPAADARTSA